MKDVNDLFKAIGRAGNKLGVDGEKTPKTVVFRPKYAAIAAGVVAGIIVVGAVVMANLPKPAQETGGPTHGASSGEPYDQSSHGKNTSDGDKTSDRPLADPTEAPEPSSAPSPTGKPQDQIQDEEANRRNKNAKTEAVESLPDKTVYVCYAPVSWTHFTKANITAYNYLTNVFSEDVRRIITDNLNGALVPVVVKGEHENCYPVVFEKENNKQICLRCNFSQDSGVDKEKFNFNALEIDKELSSTRRIIVCRTSDGYSNLASVWLYDYDIGKAERIEFPEYVRDITKAGVSVRTNGKLLVSYNDGSEKSVAIYDVNEKTWKKIYTAGTAAIGVGGSFVTDEDILIRASLEGRNKAENYLYNIKTEKITRLDDDIMSVIVSGDKIIEYGDVSGMGLGGLFTKDINVIVRSAKTGEKLKKGYVIITGETENASRALVRRNIETGEEEIVLSGVMPNHSVFTEDGKYWIAFSKKEAKIAIIDIDSGDYIYVDMELIEHNAWTTVDYYFGRCPDVDNIQMFWTGGDNDFPTEVTTTEENTEGWKCWDEYLKLKAYFNYADAERFSVDISMFDPQNPPPSEDYTYPSKFMDFRDATYFDRILLTALEYKGEKTAESSDLLRLVYSGISSKNGSGNVEIFEVRGKTDNYVVNIGAAYYKMDKEGALKLLEVMVYPFFSLESAYDGYYYPKALKSLEFNDVFAMVNSCCGYSVGTYSQMLSDAEEWMGYAVNVPGYEKNCLYIGNSYEGFILSGQGKLIAMWTPNNRLWPYQISVAETGAEPDGIYYKLKNAEDLNLKSVCRSPYGIRFEFKKGDETYAFKWYSKVKDSFGEFLEGIPYVKTIESDGITYYCFRQEIYWEEDGFAFSALLPWEKAEDDAWIKENCRAVKAGAGT